MKKALVFGASGQDGSYLCEFLLSKGYEVHAAVRRSSVDNLVRLSEIIDNITVHAADITDQGSVSSLIYSVRPTEIYNLAAQSYVKSSFGQPVATADMTALGVTRIVESIRMIDKSIKFYQASSSEMFGKVQQIPQNENTPFYPRSPYGVAKLYGHWITVNYRESYNMFCVSGILFNHESPRRGMEFVTRKITKAVARIKWEKQDKLYLGNLEAKRDWGHAADYVEAMWLMLQRDEPEDFVIATGETHTVKEFVEEAFDYVDLDYADYVEIDPVLYRPAEVDILLGDATKAREKLGWKPKYDFKSLVHSMLSHDLRAEAIP